MNKKNLIVIGDNYYKAYYYLCIIFFNAVYKILLSSCVFTANRRKDSVNPG